MTLEEIVHDHYEKMFEEIMKVEGDNMFDFVIEVKTLEGTTVRRSWRDRDGFLTEYNREDK